MQNIHIVKVFSFFVLAIAAFYVFIPENYFQNIFNDFLLPRCQKTKTKFLTIKSETPASINYMSIGFAKEIVNIYEKVVVISGGSKAIQISDWKSFSPFFPWQKNIDRNLLFKKTAFLRSPGIDVNCQGSNCIKQREYKGYTWVEIAKPVCVEYVPGMTNIIKPEKGHVVIKTIIKCQVVYFENYIYQLTDNQGNFFVVIQKKIIFLLYRKHMHIFFMHILRLYMEYMHQKNMRL